VNEKELDLEQLMHVALQGRIETYQELSDIECNHWQPQLMEIRLKLFEVSSAYEMLCQEVQEDLEDLFIFVAARKLTYTEEKVGLAKKEQEYTKFIEKQLKTIKGLRKDNRAMKKELQEKTRAFELNKTQIALEMRQHEANMFEKRQMVREAGAKIKRLEYQIAQLQGKVVPGLSNLQENRIQRIQSLDFRQARERKDLLSREEPSHIKDIDLLCSLKDSVDEKLGQLRKVFGANILDSDNDEDKNINASTEDGEHQEPSKVLLLISVFAQSRSSIFKHELMRVCINTHINANQHTHVLHVPCLEGGFAPWNLLSIASNQCVCTVLFTFR
jgi:hypothetical protein